MSERCGVALAVVCLLLAATPSEATVYIVDSSGGGDFTTIQEAVDVADSGDTILIRAGHYLENILSVGKYVTFLGEGVGVTVIEGAATGPTVRIEEMPWPTLSVFESLTLMCHSTSTRAVWWDWGGVEFRNVDVLGWLRGYGTEYGQDAWIHLYDSSVTGVDITGGYCTSVITGSSVEEAHISGVVHYDPHGGGSWMEEHHLTSQSNELGSVELWGGILHSESDAIGQLTANDSSGCEAVGSELPGVVWFGSVFDIRDCHVAGGVELRVFLNTAVRETHPRVLGCIIEGDLSIWGDLSFSGGPCSVRFCHNTVLGQVSCEWAGGSSIWVHPYHVLSNIVTSDMTLDDVATASLVATHNDILGTLSVNAPSDSVFANISVDPLFCDSLDEPFALQECSPCVGAGHDGESIGALGVGCECQVAVHRSSWGAIKAMFRQPPN